MSTAITVTHTHVFAEGVNGGNPCPVVLDAADLTAEDMQMVARKYGQESCFVVSDPAECVPRLRFFVPEHEMSMCVHATIAAVTLLIEGGRLSGTSAVVSAPVGRLQTNWPPRTTGPTGPVSVSQFDPVFSRDNPPAAAAAHVLGISTEDLASEYGPIRSVSTSRPKLLVPLADAELLHALKPDWSAMWELCDRFDTTGVYAYSVDTPDGSCHARQFPVRAGYPEDPATGVAAAALAAHLTDLHRESQDPRRYRIHQGEAMGRPSVLSASARWNGTSVCDVEVSGSATSAGVETLHSPLA